MSSNTTITVETYCPLFPRKGKNFIGTIKAIQRKTEWCEQSSIFNTRVRQMLTIELIKTVVYQLLSSDCNIRKFHYHHNHNSSFSSIVQKNLVSVVPDEPRGGRDWFTTLMNMNPTTPVIKDEVITANKRAAIRELLENIGINRIVTGISQSIMAQLKQLVPIIERDIINDKKLTPAREEVLVKSLGKFYEKEIYQKAAAMFQTPEFWSAVVRTHYLIYARYYTTEELKDLASFFRSSTGKKFLNFKSQVSCDITDDLLKEYASGFLQSVRIEVEKEVLNMLSVID